jgi:hypothetical protein
VYRSDQTGLCACLWTVWGWKLLEMDGVGTPLGTVWGRHGNLSCFGWSDGLPEDVDNFLLRHADHGTFGVSRGCLTNRC